MNVRSQLVYVSTAILFALGLLGLANPFFTAKMLGLEIADVRGISQVRATFGAMHLALGGLVLRGAVRRAGAPAILGAAALLVGAVAAARLLSVVIDGAVTLLNVLFLLSEIVALAGILLAWFDARRPQEAGPNP
ncbi:MAG: DUF4345 family protein [Trueperaceae bacterium]|nr:DUF4345 family protein [Trueperaceae bacterium]HRQ11199.1 DUF4345 family protein [Trueperaceae bacterium]